MEKRIEQILKDLKGIKLTAQKIEEEVGFSNGLLGKAAKGKCNLSEEKMKLLEGFYFSKLKVKDLPEDTEPETSELDNLKKENAELRVQIKKLEKALKTEGKEKPAQIIPAPKENSLAALFRKEGVKFEKKKYTPIKI